MRVSVAYVAPDGWEFHHPSGAVRDGMKDTWIYPSLEILLDTPVVMGAFTLEERVIQDVSFYFVFVDEGVGFDARVAEFVDRVAVAIRAAFDVFEVFPFTDFTFILSLNPQADWGLAHLSSTMVGIGPDVFVDAAQFARGVRVCVHQLFHAWNVRRLRPAPLGRVVPNVSRGSSEGLWMAEGLTRYYEFLLSTRAGGVLAGAVLQRDRQQQNRLLRQGHADRVRSRRPPPPPLRRTITRHGDLSVL